MLERFRKAKEPEITALAKAMEAGAFPEPLKICRPSFAKALKDAKLALICEYKRASPSRGLIRADLSVEDVAHQYQHGGASALSVLTEQEYFKGDFAFVDRAAKATGYSLPILRKDFLFDLLQVRATAASRASAILLIVRATPDVRFLRKAREEAASLGLESIVEIFNADELALARESGAEIIQVNARDLAKLQVDRAKCLEIIKKFPPVAYECWIAASGMEKPEHLAQAANAGYDAALVGSALMASPKPGNALKKMLAGLEHAY